jgi:hypothetical protein
MRPMINKTIFALKIISEVLLIATLILMFISNNIMNQINSEDGLIIESSLKLLLNHGWS